MKTRPNQKIASFEIGYGYRSEKLSGNINLYSTSLDGQNRNSNFSNNRMVLMQLLIF